MSACLLETVHASVNGLPIPPLPPKKEKRNTLFNVGILIVVVNVIVVNVLVCCCFCLFQGTDFCNIDSTGVLS